MNTSKRLTDMTIAAALKQKRTDEAALLDPAVPGLSLRIYPSGAATWTQFLRVTSHVLRRTVATRLAEQLGDEGDKLVKRVLGHSDGSVTAIYNRYAYVREMRRVLEKWANDLTNEVGTADAAAAAPVSGSGRSSDQPTHEFADQLMSDATAA